MWTYHIRECREGLRPASLILPHDVATEEYEREDCWVKYVADERRLVELSKNSQKSLVHSYLPETYRPQQ